MRGQLWVESAAMACLYKGRKITMIAARVLPEILEKSLGDGLDGICLMTSEGNSFSWDQSGRYLFHRLEQLLSRWGIHASIVIVSLWVYCGIICLGMNEVVFHLSKLDEGWLGVYAVGKHHIIAGAGRAAPGLLKLRLQTLSQYYNKLFEQIKWRFEDFLFIN